jgi:hypothetical protein
LNKVSILELSDSECTTWTGGVNNYLSDSDDDYFTEDERDRDDMDEILVGLDKDEVLDGLRQECQTLRELDELTKPNLYDRILTTKTSSHWKKAEKNRALGYTGNSARRKRELAQIQRENEKRNSVARKRLVFRILISGAVLHSPSFMLQCLCLTIPLILHPAKSTSTSQIEHNDSDSCSRRR